MKSNKVLGGNGVRRRGSRDVKEGAGRKDLTLQREVATCLVTDWMWEERDSKCLSLVTLRTGQLGVF